jgi:hypothetical protein
VQFFGPAAQGLRSGLGREHGDGTEVVMTDSGDVTSVSGEDGALSELERLRAENEALKSQKKEGLRLQVSQKGAVSLYGIRRFPVTFYVDEWETILGMADEIRTFSEEHMGELKRR